MPKKIHVGHAPMTGIKYKFLKARSSTKLWLTIGTDIQKQLKLKRGNRVLLEFDKKNYNKILMSKTKTKERGTYSVVQGVGAKALHICFAWKFKKPKAVAFKKGHQAKLKTRTHGILIELTDGGKKK